MAKLNWGLAGMTNGEGEISNRVPPGEVDVPNIIELKGDALVWKMDDVELKEGERFVWRAEDAEKYHHSIQPPDTLLNSFVKLADAPADKILRFAEKYGVLDSDRRTEHNWGARNASGRDSIASWRRLASNFRSILNVSAAVRLGEMGERKDWENFVWPEPLKSSFLPENPSDSASAVWVNVTLLMAGGSIGLRLWHLHAFDKDFNDIGVKYCIKVDFCGFLYNALLFQLMLAIAGSDLFICDGCQHPYARPKEKKRPRQGQANFCDDCGTAVALKQADRRRKQKMAEARRLHAEGVAPGEIAKRLDTKPATVRGWIKKAKS